jgi:hypothetical protein
MSDVMRNNIRNAALKSALLIILLAAAASEALAGSTSYENLYSGILYQRPDVEISLIRDEEALGASLTALGADETLAEEIDFDRDALVLIASARGDGGVIRITDVESAYGVLTVRYVNELTGPVPENGPEPVFPFLLVKIKPVSSPGTVARIVDSGNDKGFITSGTGLGQFEPYTNVLDGGAGNSIAEYVPLEEGNTWTYSLKSDNDDKEITNTIVTEVNGWSAFEKFFGIPFVGMRIAPDGEMLVRVGSSTKTFYTPDVVRDFVRKKVVTPAGTFEDVMVVSIKEGGKFWFRDVYARGVGLVLHEQRSPNGKAEYLLVAAEVRGKKYPARE